MCYAWVGYAITAVSAYMSYQGNQKQAKAAEMQAQFQRQEAQNNAIIAEQNAQDALKRGDVAEKQHRLRVSQMKGTQRSLLAAQGREVDSGSALDILADTAEQGELDALTIRANAQNEARRARIQGRNFVAQGELALLEGTSRAQAYNDQATGSLLSAGGKVASSWYRSK